MPPPGTDTALRRAKPRVVVVGDVMADVVVRFKGPFAPASDTPSAITLASGGSAANEAVWCAAAGADVTLVAAVGEDVLGASAAAELAASKVTMRLSRVAGATTGVVVSLVRESGERSMLTDRGANLRLEAGDLPDELFSPGAHLHLSAYVLYDETTRPVAERALSLAATRAMTASVDPCSVSPLLAFGAEAFLAATTTASWCFANRDEAAALTGRDEPARAAALLGACYGEATVTAGADGAFIAHEGNVLHVPARATRVVDTTGAGDAFTGTYLAHRLVGEDPESAAVAAVAAASRVVAEPGARPGGALGYSRL